MVYSALRTLKEHGAMTFEELIDTLGCEVDAIDLQLKLNELVETNLVIRYENTYGRTIYDAK